MIEWGEREGSQLVRNAAADEGDSGGWGGGVGLLAARETGREVRTESH